MEEPTSQKAESKDELPVAQAPAVAVAAVENKFAFPTLVAVVPSPDKSSAGADKQEQPGQNPLEAAAPGNVIDLAAPLLTDVSGNLPSTSGPQMAQIPVKKKYKKKNPEEKKERKKREPKNPKVPKIPKIKKTSGSIAKGMKNSPKKRGRKTAEWYAVNNKMPGFTKYNKKKKKKQKRDYLDDGMLFAKTGPGPGLSSNSPLMGAPYYLTTKDILDLVFQDHNYCQVLYSTNRSKVQPFRHLFGPKDEYKAQFYPENLISPNKFLPPVQPPPPPPPPPPPTSKLEFLLKGGDATAGAEPKKRPQPTVRRYWEPREESSEEIDIMTPEPRDPIPYEPTKAKNLMMQCEKHAKIIKPTNNDEDWERHIVRTGWTKIQAKLYDDVIRGLHGERLSRLAYDKNFAEPVLRRSSLDRTTQIVRTALCEVHWNTKLTQWLHSVLIDNLNQFYLAMYLDVLQTLRARSPTLVDKMIVISTAPQKDSEPLPSFEALTSPKNTSAIEEVLSRSPTAGMDEKSAANALKEVLEKKTNNLSADALNLLLKKPWDPFSPVVHHTKLKRLACNPVFLYIPCVSLSITPASMRRFKNFCNMFAALGKVITLNIMGASRKGSVAKFASRLLTVTKLKINELRKTYPDRPLYLIGWGTGSVVATTASVTQSVDGVIALGFPLFGLSGPRGTLEDRILDMKKPVLFVIGGRSADCNLTDMELLRKQLNCETSLVMIGCGDKNLLIERYHREKLLVTQSWVDKCIVNEVSYFINLHSKHQQVTAAAVMEKSVVKLNRKSMPSGGSFNSEPRNRNISCGSGVSISDMKPSPLMSLVSDDCSVDGMSFDSSLDDSVISLDDGKKGKKRKTPKKKEKVQTPSGSTVQDDVSQHQASPTRRPSTSIKDPVEAEFISPVLSYLGASGATPGQGGLLHGLLSPPIPAAGSSDVVLPFSSSATKAPKLIQRQRSDGGEKKKRAPRPKKPKVPPTPPQGSYQPMQQLPPPQMSNAPEQHKQLVATQTILAGGATATPTPVPIQNVSNLDPTVMRQYVIQHQQVMQKHLSQYQLMQPPSISTSAYKPAPGSGMNIQPSVGQSHLLRLLSPSSIPNAPIPVPYAAPQQTLHQQSIGPDQNQQYQQQMQQKSSVSGTESIKLPSDLNVTFVNPADVPASVQQQAAGISADPLPQTAMISRQQLMSGLTTPLLRLPQIPSTTNYHTQSVVTSYATAGGMTMTSSSSGQIFQHRTPMPQFSESAQANVVFKAADKTIATNLRQADLKALFDGGVVRFVVPGESGQNIPVNIILKQQQPIMTTTSTPSTFQIQSSTPATTSNMIFSSASAGSSSVGSGGNTVTQFTVMPQEAPGVLKSNPQLAKQDVIQTQDFGQIFRTPLDSQGNSNSQVPVSVLMPKQFVARDQTTQPPSLPPMTAMTTTTSSGSGSNVPAGTVIHSTENLKIISVTSLAPSQAPETPQTATTKATPKKKKTPAKKKSPVVVQEKSEEAAVVAKKSSPAAVIPKGKRKSKKPSEQEETKAVEVVPENSPQEQVIVGKKSTVKHIAPEDESQKSKKEDPVEPKQQVLAKKSTPPSTEVKPVETKTPSTPTGEDKIGQVTRSLRPKSYPGPKRKRQASSASGASVDKKKSRAASITKEEEKKGEGESTTASAAESKEKEESTASRTPKKRTSTNTNSGDSADESTPRLTRSSMRRQSTSGGT